MGGIEASPLSRAEPAWVESLGRGLPVYSEPPKSGSDLNLVGMAGLPSAMMGRCSGTESRLEGVRR